MPPTQTEAPPLRSPVITAVKVSVRPCKRCQKYHYHTSTRRKGKDGKERRRHKEGSKEPPPQNPRKVQNDGNSTPTGWIGGDPHQRGGPYGLNPEGFSGHHWPFDPHVTSNGSRPYNPNTYPSSQWVDQDGGPTGRLSTTTLGQPPYPPLDGGGGLDKPVNGTGTGRAIIIRGEEVGIVVVVLLLWVGAIVLFFNRWGKIRMLEPYQPKFCEDHRPSCPMADVTSIQQYPRTFSKCNISTDLIGSPHFAKCNYHGVSNYGLGPSVSSRPRQNSVFVTSPHAAAMVNSSYVLQKASRKTKSAIDLSTLVLSEEFLENDEENEEEKDEDDVGEVDGERIPLKTLKKSLD